MKLRRIFQVLTKTRPFSAAETFDRFRNITFKNGGHCVRALRCHQGRPTPHVYFTGHGDHFFYLKYVFLIVDIDGFR